MATLVADLHVCVVQRAQTQAGRILCNLHESCILVMLVLYGGNPQVYRSVLLLLVCFLSNSLHDTITTDNLILTPGHALLLVQLAC